VERRQKNHEFFAQLQARRYRFIALFGAAAAKPYEEIFEVQKRVLIAARMLIAIHQSQPDRPIPRSNNQDRQKWQEDLGWADPQTDPLRRRLDHAVEAMEKICQPLIQEAAE
jgi:hypothetical protein